MNCMDTGNLSDLTAKYVTSKPGIADALSASRDDIIEELGRIDQLILRKNEEIRLLQSRRRPWQELLTHIEALLHADARHVNNRIDTRMARPVSVTDAAFDVLQRTHSFTHYKEIAKKLQEKNVTIPGKNPSATLLSRISRDDRFRRGRKRGEYGLSIWRTRSGKSNTRRSSKNMEPSLSAELPRK